MSAQRPRRLPRARRRGLSFVKQPRRGPDCSRRRAASAPGVVETPLAVVTESRKPLAERRSTRYQQAPGAVAPAAERAPASGARGAAGLDEQRSCDSRPALFRSSWKRQQTLGGGSRSALCRHGIRVRTSAWSGRTTPKWRRSRVAIVVRPRRSATAIRPASTPPRG